jgi:small multidrug resistance pump
MIDLQAYRKWFYAAAIYNFVWGTVVGLFPKLPFDVLHIPLPTYLPLMQCIGMIVGVYGLGYWLIAVDPDRYGPFVWIGLAGKVLGPLGFVWAAYKGELPWSFGWINVTNDLIWLPSFIPFALAVWRNEKRRAGVTKGLD